MSKPSRRPEAHQIKQTAGTWDRRIAPRYFIAGDVHHIMQGSGLKGPFLSDVLIPVADLISERQENDLRTLLDAGSAVLIDSGVFTLANSYASKHKIDVIEALTMPPERLDGYKALLDRYRVIMGRYGDRAWGYIEFDVGGREAKKRCRAMLEAEGLRPIPVYHPFSDGWDYFDELARSYDRICLANLGTATPEVRRRLVATTWQRAQAYPHLWVHCLGLSPSPLLLAFPLGSCDSSSWVSVERWGELRSWAMLQPLWDAGRGWRRRVGSATQAKDGADACYALLGWDGAMQSRALTRIIADERAALGF